LFPSVDPLGWWIMPLAFGGGQIAIGAIVLAEPDHERTFYR
jgi:hypothetical protein